MKPCAKCRAELPDTAELCIYCGTIQGGGGLDGKATMMGHPGMAEQLRAARKPPSGFKGHMTPTMLSTSDDKARAEAQEQPPQQQQPYEAQQQQQQQPYGGAPQQPYGGAPQQQQQPYGGAPQQQPYGGRPPLQQAPFGGADFGIQNAQFGAAAHHQRPYGAPGEGSYRDALTEQVKPLPAPGRNGEIEMWDESLTTQLLVFGVLLVACFVAPWALGGGKTVFAWSVLGAEDATMAAKLQPIMLAGTGIIAVALGALKLSAITRAFAATGLGLAPILFQIVNQESIAWQVIVGAIASVTMITGLILRSRHPYSQLSRILATVGACAIIALYLIPEDGHMLISSLFDQIGNSPGKAKLIPIVGSSVGVLVAGVLPLLLTALALSVWLPRPGRAGTHILTWTILFWALAASITGLLVSGDVLATLKAGLNVFFYLPLAGAAWLSLACFGIASVVGNQLDR